jgi:hypothetical protein
MDDRTKTIAAVAIIVGVILLVVVAVAAVVTRKTIVSPVPDDGAIRIVFVTPTLVPAVSLAPTETPAPTAKPGR